MWTTVLVLALALNFEPHRLGIIGLLLIGRHPIRQLLIFLVTSFAVSASAGLLILFAVDRTALINGGSGSAKMQIVIGAVLFIVAAVLFSNISVGRHSQESVAAPHAEGNGSGDPEEVETHWWTRSPGNSPGQPDSLGELPWLAVILGVGIALPSVDYIALLLLIATSGMSPRMQITALFTFLTIANTVLFVPIFSYLVAKERTIRVLEGLRSWVLARRRRDYALLLGIAGALLIAVGIKRL